MMNTITITMTIRTKMVSVGMPEQISRSMGLVSKTELCDNLRLLCRNCLTRPWCVVLGHWLISQLPVIECECAFRLIYFRLSFQRSQVLLLVILHFYIFSFSTTQQLHYHNKLIL